MASGTIREINDEFLECHICFEAFKQPKMLPCLHTFCQPCLERLLATEPAGKLSCPTCRVDAPLPKDGVRGFKNNFLVVKLRDIVQEQPKGKVRLTAAREDAFQCTACDTSSLATCYCVNCTDFLCEMCTDAHRRVKTARSHKIVPVEDVTSGRLTAELRATETSKCQQHEEVNKFYCDTCRLVVCLHCVVTQHKDHCFMEIQQAAQRERVLLSRKCTAVQQMADLYETKLHELRPLKDAWSKQIQDTTEELEMRAHAVAQAAMKAKDEKISALRILNAHREKDLDATINMIEMKLTLAKSCIHFTDHVLEYGSPAELCSVSEELSERLEQNAKQKIAKNTEPSNLGSNLGLDIPKGDIEEEVAQLVGEVKMSQHANGPSKYPAAGPSVIAMPFLKTFGKEGDGNGEFRFPTSLALLPNGNIVVTDLDNKRLQVFDQNGAFRFKVKLSFDPWSVATSANGDLLVTGDRRKIHVLDQHGRKSRVIHVWKARKGHWDAWENPYTKGIAVDNIGRVIVTILDEVLVLSPTFKTLFKVGKAFRGQEQMRSSLRVATNSRNHIIVCDDLNSNIKVFAVNGCPMFTCGSFGSGPAELNRPYCVTTDAEDNIIVADWGNHRVSQFAPDGTFLGQILTRETVYHPMAVAMTTDGRLVFSHQKYREGCIGIFTID